VGVTVVVGVANGDCNDDVVAPAAADDDDDGGVNPVKRGLLAPNSDVADAVEVDGAADPKLDPNEKDVGTVVAVAFVVLVDNGDGMEAEANRPPVLPPPNMVADDVLAGVEEELPKMDGVEEELPDMEGIEGELPKIDGAGAVADAEGVADDVCPNVPNTEAVACC
jgi:hypothetical protein